MTVLWPSGVQLGCVSPMTIAGSITLGIAENLAGLVLCQSVRPGNGYVGTAVTLTVDMNTTQAAYGTPEHCLGESLVADIYHYLDLPCWETACASDSKIVDEQCALECAFTCLLYTSFSDFFGRPFPLWFGHSSVITNTATGSFHLGYQYCRDRAHHLRRM